MDVASISCLSKTRLPSNCRLLASACCPDKDLVVLLTRFKDADRMSLWKLQGAKRWEIDTYVADEKGSEIVALSWSPNGGVIVAAHHPPKLSLHSVEDGHVELVLHIPFEPTVQIRITNVCWLKDERVLARTEPMADLFQRGHTITGSASSILKTLLRLDPIDDDHRKFNENTTFNIRNSTSTSLKKNNSLPSVISSWPALPSDATLQPIQVLSNTSDVPSDPDLVELNKSNLNSVLVAVDSIGQVHCFLDGSYYLGSVSLRQGWLPVSVFKDPQEATLFVQAEHGKMEEVKSTTIKPVTVRLPLLDSKTTRRVAENSTAARDLIWYMIRTIKEMRQLWLGEDDSSGARGLNIKWMRGLYEKQAHFGQQESNAISDLTHMLTTGRASEALSDYLSSGEQTSERGFQKWEAVVTEALIRIRDYSEKHMLPACQSLHLLLEEVRGWALLPQQYSQHAFDTEAVDMCLDLNRKCIFLATWLAKAARRELLQFKEFMAFLRYECSRGHPSNPDMHNILPRHDILEVNSYLTAGLASSPIDAWFDGPVSNSIPYTGSLVVDKEPLSKSLKDAMETTENNSKLRRPLIQKFFASDKNLDSLIEVLAENCKLLYAPASQAVTRAAYLDPGWPSASIGDQGSQMHNRDWEESFPIREYHAFQPGKFFYKVLLHVGPKRNADPTFPYFLLIIRENYHYVNGNEGTSTLEMAAMSCMAERHQGNTPLHVFDLQFFDEDNIIIVYGDEGPCGPATIAMIDCSDGLGYQSLNVTRSSNYPRREDAVSEAIRRIMEGDVTPKPLLSKKRRVLSIARSEGLTLAVNGRVGRRVACILDGSGTEMETFDMEGEDDVYEVEDADATDGR